MKKVYSLLVGLLFAVPFISAQEYTPGNGDGLKGTYWKGATNFDQEESEIFWNKRPQGTVATKEFERIDPVIDFGWGNGNPFDDTMDDFAFCIEWNGYLLAPVTSNYTFDFTHWDDGYYFALYDLKDLENPLVTSEFWGTGFGWDRPEWTCNAELEENTFYKIVIKYYENEFGAHARFSWFIDEASIMTEVVPQSQLYSSLESSVGCVEHNFRIFTQAGGIRVKGLEGEDVRVYDTFGRCEYFENDVVGERTVNLSNGLYVVKIGSIVEKVLINL